MKIKKHLNPVAGENTYLVSNDEALLVIDPGSDTQGLLQEIDQINKPIAAILLTHTHYDHIISVDAIREQFNRPPVYVHPLEADWLGNPALNGSARHPDLGDVIISPADVLFENGRAYNLSGFKFRVLPTPGHSHGSVSLVFDEENLVFSGDALFKETIGRTDLPTGDFDTLINSIKTQLLPLPSRYDVHPGHGFNTTIGHEKTFNPFLQ
ncbi:MULTISPECIES: MBL fold metallo-hydrolase [Streptococcus]|uniref:MBL fold metallo-hydrolase n=1 Tax=Streptococcus caledonicus TaxID=2614158 RepID=A0ABW0UB84_9STRE|nr:MBL fold metallo-hydrolase [Streptococcus sp. S784/96/1]